MKMTLLEMTQNILSAMDSDDVNSISDTVESLQVANVIIESYYENFAGLTVPDMEGLIKLDALADVTRPCVMRIPDNVKNIKWIRYNGIPVLFIAPEDFLTNSFEISDDAMLISDTNLSTNFYVKTNQDPTRWTTFDNVHIFFNSYDSSVDSTLQQSKTTCWGQYTPVFELRDDAYPPYISVDKYPGLLAEAKSACFMYLKQVSSSKDEQRARRQRVRQQNDQWRFNQANPNSKGPNYGRRGRYS